MPGLPFGHSLIVRTELNESSSPSVATVNLFSFQWSFLDGPLARLGKQACDAGPNPKERTGYPGGHG